MSLDSVPSISEIERNQALMITIFHRNEAVQYIHRLYLTADHYLGICLNLKYFFIVI